METIQLLRNRIDALNLQLLGLLSERARLAEEIGEQQTQLGTAHYDPVRESEMLAALTAANQGPFSDGVVKSLFKSIFQASMQLEDAADQVNYLTSRQTRKEDTVVYVGDVPIGHEHAPVLIAGPCSIESETQLDAVARFVAERGVKLLRGGAFKPRTDPYSFQGLGVEGLKLGREVCDRYDLKFISEIMDAADLDAFSEYADMLQIGARNMQNFTLLKAVGRSNKPVLLKRGLSATIEEWVMAAEYLLYEGNENVVLCERGIRTFETATRNTLDLNAIPYIKQKTHLPVLVDPSHGTGIRDLVTPMSLAAAACGADGLLVEVHENPAAALSDGAQSLYPMGFEALMTALRPVVHAVGRELA